MTSPKGGWRMRKKRNFGVVLKTSVGWKREGGGEKVVVILFIDGP